MLAQYSCFLLATWHGAFTFSLDPVLLVTLVGLPHIYNSSVDCLVYFLAGLYCVLSRKVTLVCQLMGQYCSNKWLRGVCHPTVADYHM